MHKCLCIPEIQATILDNLTLSDRARVARTSSSFFEQAMNATWAELSSLVPLVRCMPSDAMEERVTTLPFGPPYHEPYQARYREFVCYYQVAMEMSTECALIWFEL